MKKDRKTIGVLTGGGDCPGLNPVIWSVVRTAINDYGWRILGIEDGFEGFLKSNKIRELRIDDVKGLFSKGGTILGTSNRGNPFKYTVNEDGKERVVDQSHMIIKAIKDLNLYCLIVIGGDGSLSIALDLFKQGVPIIGIPKTIDNDLSSTDVTFGFLTAVETATSAIEKLHTTAESHHRIMVVEVMGRYAGWIALYAGIAGGADIILIPEIPFNYKKINEIVNERCHIGKTSSIIVVAEGAKPKGGKRIYQNSPGITLEQLRLGGIGYIVGDKIQQETGIDTRITVLGHLQRGGSPSAFDRILSCRFGSAAVKLAANGEFGKMVSLRSTDIKAVDLKDAVKKMNGVPLDCDQLKTARSVGISFGD
jgi:ATP-dependent phosphofructokinase / diphosphate-dependent phosphofructokinase